MMREGSFVKLQCAEVAGKLVALLGERKTKCACIVDSSESTRKRVEGSLHTFIPMPQAIKNTRCERQQWTRNGRNSRRYRLGS